MRLKSIRLENYGGIFNGLGLHEIYIDFTKCMHNMLVIKGDNGTGKSTLFNAITPLPDSNDIFIPNLRARKTIEYFGPHGEIYQFDFIHDVKERSDGVIERLTTKGYIKKDIGAGPMELNPTGNISSCRDIIYAELKLDPNFISLSQLSSNDRGLATKKPAERKRFVSSIINSVEVYNNIHKVISKRSSVFKSMINNIISKLDSIGNEDILKSNLKTINDRIAILEKDKDRYSEGASKAKGVILHLDPNNTIRAEYDTISKSMSDIKIQEDIIQKRISNISNELGIQDMSTITNVFNSLSENIMQAKANITILDSKVSTLLADREAESLQLQNKINKLNALQGNGNYLDIKKNIKIYQDRITEIENTFKTIGILDGSLLSKDEYLLGLNALKDIKGMLEAFKSGADYEDINIIFSTYIPSNTYPDTAQTMNQIEDIKSIISEYEKQLNHISMLETMSESYSKIPKQCKIRTCPFINDTVLAHEELSKGISSDECNGLISDAKDKLLSKQTELKKQLDMIDSINLAKSIIRNIENYKNILLKLPIGKDIADTSILVAKILSNNDFHEIDILYQYIEYANIFDEYKIYKDTLYKLNTDYEIYKSKNEMIDDISKDISDLNFKISEMSDDILKLSDEINSNNTLIAEMDIKRDKLGELIDALHIIDKIRSDNKALIDRFNTIESDINTIIVEVNNMDMYNAALANINTELQPMIEERESIKHKQSLVTEYQKELIEFQNKYDRVEVIKYYTTPTTGIQNVYVELYMGKTISLANELLKLLFDGRYTLTLPVVNEQEFKIPCVGGNLPHDDISDMSSSEVACISMIISFSLLFQSSSLLNILKLDEIDGALDSTNRRNFIVVLLEMMRILLCEQCIIISHNDEINLNDCDIIVLRHENIEPINGNIIWQYRTA